MKLTHHVRTSASPALVWQTLGRPSHWPQFDVFLRSVRGVDGPATQGQHLVGIARLLSLGIPLDVLEVEPERRLVLRVRTVPGLSEEVTFVITPTVRGGSEIRVSVVLDGPLARPAVLPVWLANGLNARVLAARTHRTARAHRRTAAA